MKSLPARFAVVLRCLAGTLLPLAAGPVVQEGIPSAEAFYKPAVWHGENDVWKGGGSDGALHSRLLYSGDVVVEAELVLDKLAGTAASLSVQGINWGFDGVNGGNLFLEAKHLVNPALRPVQSRIRPGEPFRFKVVSRGGKQSAFLNSEALAEDIPLGSPVNGEIFLRPMRNEMAVRNFTIDGNAAGELPAAREIPLVFSFVPEEALSVLQARYGDRLRVRSHRDWADYLYNAKDLMTFSGKKFHGQKNHLNRFKKEFPGYRFVRVTPENYETARDFLRGYKQHTPLTKNIEMEEMTRAQELLRESFDLGMFAGYIEVDGTVVALSIGEVIGDTMHCHVEKARLDYPGAYQAIVSEFAMAACREDTVYINREDDSGEEGLRTSKLAYHPVRLLPKYWAEVGD